MILQPIAGVVQFGHREFKEHKAAILLTSLLLLQQQRSHQANDRGIVGEHTDDAGAALLLWRRLRPDLLVKPLQRIGAPDLVQLFLREGPKCQQILLGRLHQRSSSREFSVSIVVT